MKVSDHAVVAHLEAVPAPPDDGHAAPAPTPSKAPRPPSCLPVEHLEAVNAIFRRLEAARGRRVFGVVVNDGIDGETYEEVYKWREEMKQAGDEDRLDVLIHSPGGELSACYQVARLLSRRANAWEVLVPRLAASGATLICLGSCNIVMSEVAELSPIDPQVISKRHEKFFAGERQSPLEAFQAIRYLREFALASLDANMNFLLDHGVAARPALDSACNLAFHLAQPILSKIEPYDLGAFDLDSTLAVDYCRRVCNPSDSSKKTQRKVLPRVLVERYPAHEFVIDIEEAKALGFTVSEPPSEIEALFDELRLHLSDVKQYIGFAPSEGEVKP